VKREREREREDELYLVFSAILANTKYKIQTTEINIVKYKNKNTKCKTQQNKLIIESINITKNIILYSKCTLLFNLSHCFVPNDKELYILTPS